MPVPSTATINPITGAISFLLTVMVLTYLIGDNPAFRVAVYIFIGVSAGYAAAVAWHQVLYPRLVLPLLAGSLAERLLAFIPLVLGLLLLFKLTPRRANLGSPSMAFLVGVGAAVAIGGAVMGTLFPQIRASMNALNLSSAGQYWLERLSEGVVMLIGTITTLVYFHYGAKATISGPDRGKLIQGLGWVGQIFIAITFGLLFSGVFVAAMTALIERLNFIVTFLSSL
ncbi:MAG TPA: hypothetical protein VII97_05060 [Anaerolineales bacterium]